MSLKKKTLAGIKWNTVATILTTIIGILQVAILTHLLEKKDFGLIAIASMVIAFTDIFAELGITAALIHKQNICQREYSSVYWLNVGMSIVLCAILMLCAPFLADFYNQPELIVIIRYLSLGIVLNAFGKIYQTIKTKNLEFGFISKVRITTSIIGIISSTGFAMQGYGVMSLVWGQLAQKFVNQSIYVVAGMRKMRVKLHFSYAEVRDVLKIGGFQLASQILDFMAARLDLFLIGKFFNMDQLGVYNIAKELIVKPFLIINNVSGNVFSAAFAKIQYDIHAVIDNFSKLLRIISMLSAPIYASIFIFADLLVDILYAPSFAEVSTYVRILSIMGLCSSLNSQSGPVMIALGRTDLGLRWTVVRIIMTTTVLIITAKMNLFAFACGQSILGIISFFIYFLIVVREMFNDINLKRYFSLFIDVIGITCIISVPFVLFNLFVKIPICGQIIMGVVFISIYLLYLYKCQKNELNVLINIIVPERFKKAN